MAWQRTLLEKCTPRPPEKSHGAVAVPELECLALVERLAVSFPRHLEHGAPRRRNIGNERQRERLLELELPRPRGLDCGRLRSAQIEAPFTWPFQRTRLHDIWNVGIDLVPVQDDPIH